MVGGCSTYRLVMKRFGDDHIRMSLFIKSLVHRHRAVSLLCVRYAKKKQGSVVWSFVIRYNMCITIIIMNIYFLKIRSIGKQDCVVV